MDIDPAQFARAMANRVTRERGRIALRVEEFAASTPMGEPERVGLYALADEIRRGVNVGSVEPVIVSAPEPAPLADNDPGDGLPPIRESDDFTEGLALARMSQVRRGVVGYNGASGTMRGLPTD